MIRYIPILLVLSVLSCGNQSRDNGLLTVSTFNIAWLGDGINDKIERSENDYKQIADIISKLGADILALQEIENEKALERIVKYLPDYKYLAGKKHGSQNVAFLYRDVEIMSVRDFDRLIIRKGRTRPGLLIEARRGSFDFLLMNIHLKSTSRYDSTPALKEESRAIRQAQAAEIVIWADSVLKNGKEKDLIVTGDFNDYPGRKNYPALKSLSENNGLYFLTAGLRSCKYKAWQNIDHILVNNSVMERYIENSAGMFDLNSAYTKKEMEKISDHCPVSVVFSTRGPDND